MKYLKRFLLALLIFLLLSGAAVFILFTFYKKELTGLLIDNLKTNYGLTLKVRDIRVSLFSNWPHASVQLKDVFVASDLNGNKSEPILKAGSLALSFNLEKMFHKQFIVKSISISDAELHLTNNPDGTRNFEFKKQVKDSLAKPSGIHFEISKVSLRNVKFKFLNNQKGQKISINFMDVAVGLKQYADGVEATLSGKTLVDGLLFNPKKGEFLKNTRTILNLKLNYLDETKAICIYGPSYLEIEAHQYRVTSLVNLGEEKRLALQIESEKIKFERVSTLLTTNIRKVLSNFEVKRPIDAKVLIVVNLGKREEPVILAEVSGKNCDLSIGKSKIPYSEVFFKGKISTLDPTGQRGDMEHASIVFDPVKGKVYDFPFTASIHVTNLVQPTIAIVAGLLIEAQKINFEIAKDFILKGSALATIEYSGPADKLNKEEFLDAPMKLNARLACTNLSYKELNRPYVYTLNGKADIDNHDLKFKSLHLKTNITEAVLQGTASGFVSYVLGFRKGFKASLSARTDRLDLDPLFVKNDLPQKNNSAENKSRTKKMDQVYFEFTVDLFAKKLVFRKVEAENASVRLFYKNNFLDIKSIALNTCDGKITAKATIRDFNKIDADVSVQNVNVNKLFYQFENFGQEAITSDNLRGNIFVDAKFKADLNEGMQLKGETMNGEVKLKLKEGHLINYEPVQSLSNFLFRNRNFNDVSFSELNENFKLRGYEMRIQELEIASNVLNLFVVNGLYNFKGNSNLNILIPWSNLKKRGKNYIPKSSGESAENTKGVKLNFSGPNKKMKISLGHKEQEKRFW